MVNGKTPHGLSGKIADNIAAYSPKQARVNAAMAQMASVAPGQVHGTSLTQQKNLGADVERM